MKLIAPTLAAVTLVAPALAQVPAHATQLNPTTTQSRPRLLQQGDVINAFGLNDLTIYQARSTDGGRTWPVRERSLGTFLGFGAGNEPAFAAQAVGNELLLVAHDGAAGPQFLRSTDGGASWAVPVSIATAVATPAGDMRPALYANGTTTVVAWTNDRPNGRVFCNRSLDGGVTWQPLDIRLDTGAANPFPVASLHIAGDGPNIQVFWSYDDSTTWRQRSADGGATWLPQAVPMPLGQIAAVRALVASGSTAIALGGGNAVRSLDHGGTWTPLTGTGMQSPAEVAIAGNRVLLVGRSLTSATTYAVSVSLDAGATWLPSPAVAPSGFLLIAPRAFVRPDGLFVHWQILGLPGAGMRSLDDGLSWQQISGPVDAGFMPGNARTVHATSTVLGTTRRHHAYVGVGSSRLGSATAGTGGVAPSLTTDGLPMLGSGFLLHGSGAVGGSVAAVGLSLQPPVAVPFGAATVHLASLDVLFTAATSGAAGQPAAGAFTVAASIPASPALVGSRLVAQALVVDGGAGDGFTVTNALEIWIR